MTTAPLPRRNWHFTRWLIVGIIATLGWSGWRAHTFRIALAEADALGWEVSYTDPVKTVRANWKEALQKATWMDGVYSVRISWEDAFEDKLGRPSVERGRHRDYAQAGFEESKRRKKPADTHVPLFVKGPGVKTGRVIGASASQTAAPL